MQFVVLTIGFFDGVHIGHRCIIRDVVEYSRKYKYKSVVLTFDRPPQSIDGLLTTQKEKYDILKSLGIDSIGIIYFDKKFSEITPEDFFYKFLLKNYKLKKIVVGHDFMFGKNRSGDIKLLEKLCEKNNILLTQIRPVMYKDKNNGKMFIVSSSLIRDLIKENKIELVNDLLARPYCITGEVIRGKGLATKLGFPTANMKVSKDKLLPEGVFYVHSIIKNRVYPGIVNIGYTPTLNTTQKEKTVEVHIIDYSEPIVNTEISINILKMIRKEIKFDNILNLKKQVLSDINLVKNFVITGNWKGDNVIN